MNIYEMKSAFIVPREQDWRRKRLTVLTIALQKGDVLSGKKRSFHWRRNILCGPEQNRLSKLGSWWEEGQANFM